MTSQPTRATPVPPVADLPTADLEDRLCCLAGRIAAAECEFLELLAEFDARGGWGGDGMTSAAHWLSLRTGMRLGVARERVRVARALRSLPLVRAAFAAGRLSYCKVRALSRVATPPTEPELVELALGATGAQLETIVRAWRTCLRGESAAASHLRRTWRRREDDDGSVVYTLRVAPEDAVVIDAAVESARKVVCDADGHPVETPVETPEEAAIADQITDQSPTQRAQADAVVLMAESFLLSGVQGEPGEPIQVVVHADLADLDQAANMAATAAQDETPQTADAAPEQPEQPQQPERHALPRRDGTASAQRSQATRPPGCSTDDGNPLSASTVLRMLCNSPVQLMVHAADGSPLDLGRSRRHASARQRRALKSRDGCCRFPGCTQTHRLIPHHVRYWSRGGSSDMDNLVLLCPTHHRAVHELGYLVRALGQGRFSFHRPDGARLPDAADPGADPSAPLTSTPAGAWTIQPTWGGEPLDLDLLIGGLATNALISAGHRVADIRYPDLDRTLRSAVGWPEPDAA